MDINEQLDQIAEEEVFQETTPVHTLKTKLARDFFTKPTPRPLQLETIDQIQKAFETKRFVVAELPTGSGKSDIAVTISRFFGESYILTPLKSLQNQYMSSFPELLVDIRGRANYSCRDNPGLSCADCVKKQDDEEEEAAIDPSQAGSDAKPTGDCNAQRNECPYLVAKDIAKAASFTLSNFSWFTTEELYIKDFPKRKLLVVDEAHLVERRLMEFAKLKLSVRVLGMLGITLKFPTVSAWCPALEEWLEKLSEAVQKRVGEMQADLDELGDHEQGEHHSIGYRKLKKQIAVLNGYVSKIDYILTNTDAQWVMERNDTDRFIQLFPLWISKLSEKLLFQWGEKILLLSATILDKKMYCTLLGIPVEDTEFIQVPSSFPVRNRPLYLEKTAKMDYYELKKPETIRKIADRIVQIAMERHPNEKGIIHCTSYQFANDLKVYLDRSDIKQRFVYHGSMDFADKFNSFLQSKQPSIFISPAVVEGVDLSDDLSRWQILLKVPYPYMKDPLIEARMQVIPGYYDWETALTIVQACGRSVRSMTDYADTYLLDSRFNYFLLTPPSSNLFPSWFKAAIIKT